MATTVEKDAGPGGDLSLRSLSMAWGIVLVAVSLAMLLLGLVVFAVMNPSHTDLVSLQWAGSARASREVVGTHIGDFRTGLYWDFFLIAAYTVALLAACALGRLIFCTNAPSRWCLFGLVATFLAAALNIAQDVLLLVGLDNLRGTWVFRLAATASFLKFCALLVAAPIALASVWTAVTRLVTHRSTARRWNDAAKVGGQQDGPLYVPPPLIEGSQPRRGWRPLDLDRSIDRDWWPQHQRDGASTHFDQNLSLPQTIQERGTGICVSGGGIRSATVTLGALQGLRSAQPLSTVDELVSRRMSGGGSPCSVRPGVTRRTRCWALGCGRGWETR